MPQELLPALSAPTDPFEVDADDLPPELAFTPVEQRTKRWSGITEQKQRIFIAHLAATGAVTMAAKVVGHSSSALYQLRKRPGAETFAAAWDRAVEMGARRVVDLLMEHAIHGIPETIFKDGQLIAERRKFNTRAMMHIAAARFPEMFGGHLNPDGIPGSATPHALHRLKERWKAEWEQERRTARNERNRVIEDQRRNQTMDLDDRLRVFRTAYQRRIAHDPVKRAAWDMLTGPGTNWDKIVAADAFRKPQKHEWHMAHPDMIVPLAAGAGNVDWDKEENLETGEYVSAEGKDELWFDRYAAHIVEGEEGDSIPGSDKIARGDMHMCADVLRERADEAMSDPHKPVIQHPHGFLRTGHVGGGPTLTERDRRRRAIEYTIEVLEHEWNAAHTEATWAEWQAGIAG